MKKLIIIVLMFLITPNKGFAQCDEEYINSLLYSDNPTDRAFGSQIISNCNLKDFSTILVDRFLQESFLDPAKTYVSTLEALGVDEAYEIAISFIQNIENYTYDEEFEDILDAKVVANRSLVKGNNFNYFNIVTDIVTRDRPNLNQNTIQCLINTILNNSQYVEYSKNELYNSLSNSSNYLSRSLIIFGLLSCDNQNLLNYVRSHCALEPDIQIRNQFYDLLIENRDEIDKELLYKQELNDGDNVNRAYLANRILRDFGLPTDLKRIVVNLQHENNNDVIKIVNYLIDNFIPPRPTVTTTEMIDSLISFTSQLFQFNWIKDSTNYKSYLTELESQKKLYIEKDEDNLNDSIEHFLEMVEEHRKAEVLTEEGYKFLHYYETYVKENVEDEF